MADCLERLGQLDLQHHGEAFKFCFFIDGLDKHDGEHDHIVSVVQRFASSGSIKVCVASRPWLDFKDAIAQTGNYNCVLHQHTASDITTYVAGKFQETQIRGQAEADETGFKNLQREIVRKADGVFLWVFLVVRELQRGLRSKDTYHDLERRLEHIPSELSDYFTRMLDGLDSFHRKKSARLLLMCLEGEGQIPGLSVAVLNFEQPLDILDMPAEERGSDVLLKDVLPLGDRAIAYGVDLVSVHGILSLEAELTGEANEDFHHMFRVQLSHRSMLDWLKEERAALQTSAGACFDAELAILLGSLWFLKMCNSEMKSHMSDTIDFFLDFQMPHSEAKESHLPVVSRWTTKILYEATRVASLRFKEDEFYMRYAREYASFSSYDIVTPVNFLLAVLIACHVDNGYKKQQGMLEFADLWAEDHPEQLALYRRNRIDLSETIISWNLYFKRLSSRDRTDVWDVWAKKRRLALCLVGEVSNRTFMENVLERQYLVLMEEERVICEQSWELFGNRPSNLALYPEPHPQYPGLKVRYRLWQESSSVETG